MPSTAAPGQPGVLAEHAVGQHEVAGGEGQRALVNHAADAGQQLVARRGKRAADGHPGRVVEVHQRRDDLADQPGGLADRRQRGRVAAADAGHGRRRSVTGPSASAEPPRDRARRRHRLDAADVAADARDVRAAAHPDVPDVARRAVGAVVQHALRG